MKTVFNSLFIFSFIFLTNILSSTVWAQVRKTSSKVTPPSQVISALPVISLDEIINLAVQKSESLESLNKSIEALESEIRSRDSVLSPLLKADVTAYKDLRQNSVGTPPRDATSGLLGVSIVKPFSTGTSLSVTAAHNLLGEDTTNNYGRTDAAEWELKISQSLWRDAFGRSTNLRHEGERYELLSRRNQLEYEKRQLLIAIEAAYWDLVLAEKEQTVRNNNITRSVSLESWTQRRLKQFAAESTDLLQVQSLLAQRKLDLLIVQNSLESAKKSLQQYIPNLDFQSQQVNMTDLDKDRLLTVVKADAKLVRLDAQAAIFRSQQARTESERAIDETRPTLDVFASYGKNAIDNRFNPAWDRSINENHKQEKIGLSFAMNLDRSLTSDQKKSAQTNAEALQLRAEGLKRASDIAWTELQRNISQIKKQIKVAREVNQLQTRKLNVEKSRYEQGRTTTLQMTTFEVEATTSELTLYRLQVALRKAESLARLYTSEGT